ncbi:MAG: S41 family peptidase, partial [Rhodococcus sp. (in: high G+C Gram-positive bacteria)]
MELNKKKVTKIILDLRDNPGGLLNQVIEIGKNFITKGPIVHIQARDTVLVTHMSTTP